MFLKRLSEVMLVVLVACWFIVSALALAQALDFETRASVFHLMFTNAMVFWVLDRGSRK